jgi:hypothetical protein
MNTKFAATIAAPPHLKGFVPWMRDVTPVVVHGSIDNLLTTLGHRGEIPCEIDSRELPLESIKGDRQVLVVISFYELAIPPKERMYFRREADRLYKLAFPSLDILVAFNTRPLSARPYGWELDDDLVRLFGEDLFDDIVIKQNNADPALLGRLIQDRILSDATAIPRRHVSKTKRWPKLTLEDWLRRRGKTAVADLAK